MRNEGHFERQAKVKRKLIVVSNLFSKFTGAG